MSIALSQTARFAIGPHKQDDISTALSEAEMVSFQFENDEYMNVTPATESNKEDKGKGPDATQLFKSHYTAGGPWNGKFTSQAVAMIAAYVVGAATKVATTATGGFKYTMDFPDLGAVDADLLLPVTTGLIQVGSVRDIKLTGLACEEFGFEFQREVGRSNAKFTSQWNGSGRHLKPSTWDMPAALAEDGLNAGSITVMTLLGFDYLALDNFVSISGGFKNNIKNGYRAGSGQQDGFQVQGRMRRGVLTPTLKAKVECQSGSSEEDELLALTTGTGEIKIEGDQIAAGPEKHSVRIIYHKIGLKAAPVVDEDGIASYDLDYEILRHPDNGLCTIEVITTLDEILGDAD